MENLTSAEEASKEAAHKAKSAQQAVESAREAQLHEAIVETAKQTKSALLEGLREVFGDSDTDSPTQMKVLVRRIPILCTNIEKMHDDIAEAKNAIAGQGKSLDNINANLSKVVWIVLSAVAVAILKLVLIH